ncbi:unnamed protein product [Fraxinus pennsylvanica]|uniref:Uncharacterized protein n=1 Tax=Fraxinus pennsylvanica TaxID=56036 RepID=A0AAD1Z8N6_9LAMI|nr:unnamed protein product [Fraxinus pennsylvanica]
MPSIPLSDPSSSQTSTTTCRLCPDDFSESMQVPVESPSAVLVPSAQHPSPMQPSAPTPGSEPSAPTHDDSSAHLRSLPSHSMITRAKAVCADKIQVWTCTILGNFVHLLVSRVWDMGV